MNIEDILNQALNLNLMSLFAYAIAVITVLTMIFGIYAYAIYKAREIQNKRRKTAFSEHDKTTQSIQKKYLFFELKELSL